jgi:hypothetical protein
MISYELDPTLHATEPHEPKLDDGFSPRDPGTADPAHHPVQPEFQPNLQPTSGEPSQVPHHREDA